MNPRAFVDICNSRFDAVHLRLGGIFKEWQELAGCL